MARTSRSHKRQLQAQGKAKNGTSRSGTRGTICAYCGKRSYASRAKARSASKVLYPGEKMSAYTCRRAPEGADVSVMWHLGHLAPLVKDGKVDRSTAYGMAPPQPARPEKWGPMPAELRATIRTPATGPCDEQTQDEGEASVTTIGEAAKLSIAGFDRSDQERYAHVNSESPLEERLALVHAAVLGYAKAHGWESYTRNRKQGLVGRANMSAILRGLFNDVRDGNKLEMLVTAMRNAATRADFIECMDAALNSELDPTWWVALRSGPRPVTEKKASGPPKGVKRHPNSGRKKGSRNRSRLELMDTAERTLKKLGRPVVLLELYENGDFSVKRDSLRDSLNELASDGRILRRPIEQRDRDAFRAAGGPYGLVGSTWVMVHPSAAEDGEVGTATWELPPTDKHGIPTGEPLDVQDLVQDTPALEESADREAKLQRARELLGAPSFDEAADRFEQALPEIKEALEQDPDVKVVTPEELARMQGLLNSGEILSIPPTDPNKLSAMHALIRAETRIGELEAEVEKLKRRNKHLLALVQTMEDDE